MKNLLIAIFLFSGIGSAFAQKTTDKIELKNGSIIRGNLVEYIVGSHVTLETAAGEIRTISTGEIADMHFGKHDGPIHENGGFTSVSSVGVLLASDPIYGSAGSFSFESVQGWEFKNRIVAGAGTGICFLNGDMQVPLYGDVQYNFMPGSLTPYVELYGGHIFSLADQRNYFDYWYSYYPPDYQGGPILGGNVGIKNYTRENFGMVFNAGFFYHESRSEYEQSFWNGQEYITVPVSEKAQIRRVRVGVGIVFG